MNDYDFKVGDQVIVSGYWQDDLIKIIENITPKGFIKVDGSLYTAQGRERTKERWHIRHIKPATEEDLQRIKNRETIIKACRLIDNIRGKLTPEQATKIIKILTEPEIK